MGHCTEDNKLRSVETFLNDITFYDKMKFRMWLLQYSILNFITTKEFREKVRILIYRFILFIFGYKPLLISDFRGEYTFVFSTEMEASLAYQYLEKKRRLVVGWWYEYNEFQSERLKDEKEGYIIRDLWIKKK